MNKDKLKVFSFCSGVGALDLPFMKDPSFEIIGFSEIDKHASAVLKYHYPEIKNYGDLTKLIPEELPDFDIIVFGFSCQPFSVAGKRMGFEDLRGQIIFYIAEIIKAKKPKYFLAENVKGLLSHNKGDTFITILKLLSSLGYGVDFNVLNAKNFGIPQNRERVFILGKQIESCSDLELMKDYKDYEDKLREVYGEEPWKTKNKDRTIEIENINGIPRDIHDLCSNSFNKWEYYCRLEEYLRGRSRREILLKPGEGGKNNKAKSNEQSGEESFIATRFLGRNGKLTSKECPTIQASDLPHIKEKEILAWSSSGRSWGREERITKDHAHTLNTGEGCRNQSTINYVKEEKIVSYNRNDGIKKEINVAHSLSASDWRGLNRNQNQNAVVEKVIEDAKKFMKKARPNEEIEYSIKNNGNIRPHRTDAKKSGISELNITYEENVGNTITGSHSPKIYRQNDIRIRKLTPLECERLMGWRDSFCKYGNYEGEIKPISNTQRFKMCGNGVVPQCVEPIKNLILEMEYEKKTY